MKLNYADRRNDNNILNKTIKIMDSNYKDFNGKISLIEISDLIKDFIANRPDGTSETVIAKNYKIMTYFPKNEKYSMTVMYNNKLKLIQWYFDINKDKCKYSQGIPYSEDLYLDVVLLPNGKYFILDEDELKEAYKNKIISYNEYNEAYTTKDMIIKMIKENYQDLYDFTKNSLNTLL